MPRRQWQGHHAEASCGSGDGLGRQQAAALLPCRGTAVFGYMALHISNARCLAECLLRNVLPPTPAAACRHSSTARHSGLRDQALCAGDGHNARTWTWTTVCHVRADRPLQLRQRSVHHTPCVQVPAAEGQARGSLVSPSKGSSGGGSDG